MASSDTDHELAARLVRDAGELLLQLRADIDRGAPADEVRDRGDRQSHDLLVAALRESRPGDAVLSEEGVDDAGRLSSPRVWIIDPLDGTREFGEPPRTDWAVHVALWEGGDLAAGAVSLPAHELTLSTAAPPAIAPPHLGPPRVVVSRTRPPRAATHVAGALAAELVEMGSAGAKMMAVVQGEADVYVHAGGQYEWDSAAPVAVARAAGLHVSRVDGSEPRYNQPDPYLPDLLVCRPELAAPALEALASFES